MHHEVLGNLEPSDTGPEDRKATIHYGGKAISVLISPDDQTFETALKLAVEVVRRLSEVDQIGKRIATTDLRDTYNSGWNAYDQAQDDGSFKTIVNPQLSESEFEEKLSLISIGVTGAEMIDLFYDDSGLFWGHTVVVNSLTGIEFKDGYAELFG